MAGLISSSGSFKNTQSFLKTVQTSSFFEDLTVLAQQGVAALASMTPIDSGVTASSWGYEIEIDREHAQITWVNNNINEGVNIAVILQYGHATGNGGYISGYDYINPAIKPIFDQIAEDVWRKVTTA